MKRYLIILATNLGNDIEKFKILASDVLDAISKAHKYIGGSIKADEFDELICGTHVGTASKLFFRSTMYSILFLSEIDEGKAYIDEFEYI